MTVFTSRVTGRTYTLPRRSRLIKGRDGHTYYVSGATGRVHHLRSRR